MQVSTLLEKFEKVGVVVNNSANYVEKVFELFNQGKVVVVPLRKAEDKYRIEVSQTKTIVEIDENKQWLEYQFSAQNNHHPAIISFTSGTEGEPKGVVITHKNLANTVERLKSVMNVDASICEYIGVPVYLSFGFGRCRLIASVGGRGYIPREGFNPSEIASMIKSDGINAISAVPSLIRILLKNRQLFDDCGEEVKWIEIGSQYMSAEEKNALKEIFPKAKIVQHYGLTEASRTTFLTIDETPDEFLESVGKVTDSINVKINKEGKILISGPHVAEGYLLGNKFISLKNKEGWFETSDLGQIQDDFIYYKGRSDDVINIGGLKISPESVELKLAKLLPDEIDFAVCRRKDQSFGEGILLVVCQQGEKDFDKYYIALIKALKKMGINAAGSIAIDKIDKLPKTNSGKIQRKLIEKEFKETPSYHPKIQNLFLTGKKMSPDQKVVGDLCEQIFKIQGITLDDSFFDLGVSSLSFIDLVGEISTIYNQKVSVNDVFKNSTIRKLSAFIHAKDDTGIKRDHPVDVLRVGDKSRPFFFVGSPVYGNRLCKKLDSSRPMYALNIFGLESLYRKKLHSFTIEDIALYFYKEIKRIQPEGPYSMGAYCADENIAMEIAYLLRENDDEVDFLAFFDVTASFTKSMTVWEKSWNKLKNLGPIYLYLMIKRKLLKVAKKIKYRISLITNREQQKADAGLNVLERDKTIVDRFWAANREYVPQPVAVNVTAFRSKEWSSDPLEILSSYVDSYEEIPVPGYHSEMFLEDQSINVLVNSLNQRL